jgi:hypothetical protein
MVFEIVLSSFQTPNHVTCICHVEMNLGQFRTLLSSYYELDFASSTGYGFRLSINPILTIISTSSKCFLLHFYF